MAIFSNDPKTFERIDWQLLQNGPVNLYLREQYLREDLALLVAQIYHVRVFNTIDWHEQQAMHNDLKRSLYFPKHYGNNLNALKDCLGDVEIPDEGGLALVFFQFDTFAASDPKGANSLLDILANSSRLHLLHGKRLIVLLQVSAWDFHTEPFGATTAHWNRREFLKSNRKPSD